MFQLMTKHFAKWAFKQKISLNELSQALSEIQRGMFEANLGGNVYKKRIRFEGRGKSGSGRTIICYKKEDKIIFIHGFAKNEKANLTVRERQGFKELAKILLNLSSSQIHIALLNGDLIEVKS